MGKPRPIYGGNWQEGKGKYIHQVYKSETNSSNSHMLKLTEHKDIFFNTCEPFSHVFYQIQCYDLPIAQPPNLRLLSLIYLFFSDSTSNSPVKPPVSIFKLHAESTSYLHHYPSPSQIIARTSFLNTLSMLLLLYPIICSQPSNQNNPFKHRKDDIPFCS